MISKINVKGYLCHLAQFPGADTITYMLYPALAQLEDKWVEKMALEHKINLVMVYVPAADWNNALTPWPEPPEAKGFDPFGGKAPEFLDFLQTEIIPSIESKIKISFRDLVGVSLGGLFTLWQWMICNSFRNIASLSGSFWYEGFVEWFDGKLAPFSAMKQSKGMAYFLLGEEEPKAHIQAYQSVGDNTLHIVEKLKQSGINVTFEWVPGNHFSRPVHRAEKALEKLYPL
ncbi:MAG: hypothetical protein J1F38_07075 [Muribaculaceae bacterium]|nr:hypothetical protein [Muribaculaceae bacterium]